MVWVVASLIALCSLCGVMLTIVTLPGTWFMLLVALIAKLVTPEIFSWWVVVAAGGFVLLAEIADIASSAVGAKAGGATKKGMTGALIGGFLGAIAGSVFIPIPVVGTILGGILGAAALAVIMERNGAERTWKESGKAGAGAAVGRVAATFIKAGIAIAMGLVLTTAAFWPKALYPVETPTSPDPQYQSPGMIQPE